MRVCSFAVLCWEIVVRKSPERNFTEDVNWGFVGDIKDKVCRTNDPARPKLELINKHNCNFGLDHRLCEEMKEIITGCWSTRPSNLRCNWKRIGEQLESLSKICNESQYERNLFKAQLEVLRDILNEERKQKQASIQDNETYPT